jgi:hypothetical protein
MTTPCARAARESDAGASPAREKRRRAFGGRRGGKLLLQEGAWREGGQHEVMETWSRDGSRIVAFVSLSSAENSRDHVCTVRLYCERRCVTENFASVESESRVRVLHGGRASRDGWREAHRTRRSLRNASGFKEPDVARTKCIVLCVYNIFGVATSACLIWLAALQFDSLYI